MFMKWKILDSSPTKESRGRGDTDLQNEDESVSRTPESHSSCPGFAKAAILAIVDDDEETHTTLRSETGAEKTMSPSQWRCSRLGSSCQHLWENELLLDCTVACPHGKVMAHKVVLSAASNYLLNILHENQGDHPTLILDTSVDCLKHLMRFMYYGVLPPEENEEFFELATKLKLHGVNGLAREAREAAAEDQTSHPRRGGRPPASGRLPPPPPPPASDADTPPPAPRRRRGRPRKTPQVTRIEDCPPVEEAADDPVTRSYTAPPPTEVNVKVVQTLAGTVEILQQPQAVRASGSSGAVSAARRGRCGLAATAGIPEQLFGGAAAAGDSRPPPAGPQRHTGSPGGPRPDRADDSDSDAADPAGDAELESGSDPAWESVLGLDSSHGQSSYEQSAARISKSERPTRLTASSVQCGYCGKMCCNKETLKVHRRIHTDERPYMCPSPGCNKSFRQRIHLRRHALCHDVSSEHKQYPCHTCGRVFRHEANLERHRGHYEREGRPCSPPRPRAKPGHRFPCNLCGKNFISQAAFNNHVRVHTNQRPFVCAVCDKGFKQKSHLTEHERIHSGQKPFKCAECDLTFYNRSRFKMHQVQHVNEALQMGKDPVLIDPKNKFPGCPICFKRFINASNLRMHQRAHSSDKPHHCHLCNSRFKLAKTLTKHLAAHASGAWAVPRHMEGQQATQQEDEEETAAAVSQVSVPLAEAGEGVIILREEEDGSLTYVPGLQEADTDGRVVQVMLGDPEPTKEAADQLMSQEGGLASKWVAASVQQVMPAGVDEPLPPADPAGPSRAAEGASSAAAQTILMETDHVDDGGG